MEELGLEKLSQVGEITQTCREGVNVQRPVEPQVWLSRAGQLIAIAFASLIICVVIYEITKDIIDIAQTNSGNFWISYLRLILSRLAS